MSEFIHGMDVSSMDEIVKLGAKFYDNGQENGLLEILKSYGANYVRLRLWLILIQRDGKPYGAGCNNLEVTMRMAKQVKALGMKWLLDFHYSDFWTDPGKQFKPKAWKNYSADELEGVIYEYTKEMMTAFKEQGCVPDMVQVGNEITNGFLWPDAQKPAYERIACYVSAGIRAVREVNAETVVMIHRPWR